MSVTAIAWAMKARVGSSTRKAVLVALCNYADSDGYCWPSQETVAFDAELSDRAVRSALAELESDGFIERSARPRRADKTRQSDLIRIVFSRATMRNVVPDALPERGAETMRNVAPDHAEPASAKPSGEPSIEPGEGAARPARPTMLPENWKPEARHVSVGIREGLNAKQLDRAARKFVLHHREVGRPLKDWDAAWERWAMKEAELLGIAREPELPIGLENGTPVGEQIFIEVETEPWEAWREKRPRGWPTTQNQGGRRGWFFPSLWPPGHPNHSPSREVA